MQVAVYGGSFNPPHVGHAMVASWLLWTERVDEVWLLPSFAHPFGKQVAPFEDRLAMCEALAGLLGPRVRVCAIERRMPTPSFTIDTLRRLAQEHPDATLRLVLGADNAPDLPKWKDWEAIESGFAPILVGRQGWPTPEGAVDFPGVSSTEVRSRLATGRPVDHLVPAPVLPLLHGIYG